MTQIERLHKQVIREGDDAALPILQRMHLLAVGIYAESLLRKIVADPHGFNRLEQQAIWRVPSQADRWVYVLELAFRRHHDVPLHKALDQSSLGEDLSRQWIRVRGVLDERLRGVIEDRNKTAHGQWVWHLKSRQENSFTLAPPAALPNYSSIWSQYKTIRIIGELVYVLVVSEPTFQRDYDRLTGCLESAELGIDGSGYAAFQAELRRRRR